MEVVTKKAMYRDLQAGRYGNVIRNWGSLEELAASGYRGLVSIRAKNTSNPVRLYHVPYEELAGRVAALPEQQRRQGLVFCESPPDHYRTIQGELSILSGSGLYFFYSYSPKPMRHALEEEGQHAFGLEALHLLQRHLWPADLDELRQLLDDYPGSTIEFSGFRVPVGVIPGRRMVVWEVRHY